MLFHLGMGHAPFSTGFEDSIAYPCGLFVNMRQIFLGKYSNMIKGTGVCLSLEGYLLFNRSTFSVSSFTAVVSVRANASLE